jgi:hypothetical protein
MPHLDGAAGPAGRALARAAARELARLRRIRGAGRRTTRRIERARLALAVGLLAAALPGGARARTPIFVNPLLPFGLPDVGGHAAVALGDLDGDGDLDALVGDTAGELLYFQNTGSRELPAFASPETNPFGLFDVGDFSAPAFADIDTDGDLDVFAGAALGDIFFFRNTGGAIAPAFDLLGGPALGLTNVGFDAAPAFGDLDGDGDLDAFIGEGASGNVISFENTGTSTSPEFGPPATNPFGLADVGFEASPHFVDLDGDGDLDALVGNDVGDLVFFTNTGTVQAPAFAGAATNPFGLARTDQLTAPAAADLDGDGDEDLLVGTFSGNLVLFSNGGSVRTPAFLGPVPIADVGYVSSPTFGDLDGDGDLDAVFGNSYGQQLFVRNEGTPAQPRFAAPSTGTFGLANVQQLAAPELVDFDGDGDLDSVVGRFVSGTDSDDPVLFRNTGTATSPAFASPVLAFPFIGFEKSAPTFGDVDDDGDLDALVGGLSGDTAFEENTGTATEPAFAGGALNPFGLPVPDTSATPSFADVDGDGDLDYLTGGADGLLTFARNDGSATVPVFNAAAPNPFGPFDVGFDSAPAFADIDADGDPDLFVGANTRGLITFLANLTPLCPEAPEPDCAAFASGSLSVDERREGNEKLALKLAKGPALAQADFGDPTVAGSQAISACIYDFNGKRAGALEVRRAGATCGAKPCWKPLGKPSPDGKGFAYKDPAGGADGVRSLKLAAGAEGRSSLSVAASNRAKKGEREMSAGIAAALSASPQVTVQVHGPGACFEVLLDDVTKQEADRFKAR